MSRTDLQRLEAKYVKDQQTGCWVWHAAVSPGPASGKWVYGVMQFGGRMQMAHRISYQLYRGPIPAGKQLDHLCRNTRCVNPWHLEPVTAKENINRGVNAQLEKTHCPKGHALAGENLYQKPNGNRECRICRAEQWEAYKARHVGAVAVEKRPKTEVWVEFLGERKTVSQWSQQTGIEPNALLSRIKRGWPLKRAMSEPIKPRKQEIA